MFYLKTIILFLITYYLFKFIDKKYSNIAKKNRNEYGSSFVLPYSTDLMLTVCCFISVFTFFVRTSFELINSKNIFNIILIILIFLTASLIVDIYILKKEIFYKFKPRKTYLIALFITLCFSLVLTIFINFNIFNDEFSVDLLERLRLMYLIYIILFSLGFLKQFNKF